ncbi:antitoxin VbhA family protein [Pseudomonas mosselii]|uniref:antitoxin VbhA family protein n=1 Tax=Pseudomonas mosselii TaxID=78327 RepID=UPI00244779CB|nr:antitoxin VbhA family protein [Pseudomonas mosselii]MDH0630558.1 antitoxin VbhA family protein [Pseudomonas mosselii]MDH0680313.1 antitoxin VbhA family protein [Pseudomonas mosselii]MDH0927430.1 antitoxin VbhA family protein [Pseudomonas mosselii]MDH1135409.1 antitoxin VbhA family protein [Pseudomonas mosselii]MDH1140380.1 antitoxin VbhA family protein [Pseudomonas mosselii]
MNTSESIIITNAERERRRKAVEYAATSIGLEGFALSADEKQRAQAFVNGELTLVEFVSANIDE